MSPTLEKVQLDKLQEQALALPVEQRRYLLASLCESFGPETLALHPEWLNELRFRSEEYRAGRMGSTSWEQYEKELDESVDLA